MDILSHSFLLLLFSFYSFIHAPFIDVKNIFYTVTYFIELGAFAFHNATNKQKKGLNVMKFNSCRESNYIEKQYNKSPEMIKKNISNNEMK
jgi:hypothetical protein